MPGQLALKPIAAQVGILAASAGLGTSSVSALAYASECYDVSLKSLAAATSRLVMGLSKAE
jgi:hypothetical protein